MSRFSKFCKFLSETGEGLKLVAFFLAAQHLFVAFYEGEADFPVLLGEVRDRFFDETSPWCLPNKVLEVRIINLNLCIKSWGPSCRSILDKSH